MRHTRILVLLTGLAAFVAGSYWLLASDPMWFYNLEALHNAGVAREIVAGNGRYLLNLQYMEFCGGCTVESLLGAALFALFGESFAVWKLVPIGFGCVQLVLGWMLLGGRRGETPATFWAVLMALPPILVAQSMVMAWGNHYEVFALVLVLALLTQKICGEPVRLSRWGAIAAVFGWTCWFGLTGAVAGLAILPLLVEPARQVVTHRGPRRVLLVIAAGLFVGVLPYVLFMVFDERDPFEFARSFQASSGRFDHLADRLSQLSLLAYAGVFQAGGDGGRSTGSIVATAALWGLVGLGLADRKRHPMPFLLLAAYGLVYALSPAEPSSLDQSGLPPPIDQRYLFPWFASLLMAAAVGAGFLWKRGNPGRLGTSLLLVAILVPGLTARVSWFGARSAVTPPMSALLPYNYAHLAVVGFWRLPPGALETGWCVDDPLSALNAGRAQGHRLAYELVELDESELVGFVERLRASPLDSSVVLEGVGREIRLALMDMGDFREDEDRFVRRLLEFERLLSDEERVAFVSQVWPANVVLGYALPDELPDGCSLCPVRGARLVVLPDRVDAVDASLIPVEALEATGERRRDLLLGASSYLGFHLGFTRDRCLSLADGLDPADAELVVDGCERGAAGRWVRSFGSDTPRYLLP